MSGWAVPFNPPPNFRAELDAAWNAYSASLSKLSTKPFRPLFKEESAVLRALPATMREIAALTGRTPHQVNASLNHYRGRGMVRRGRTVPTGNTKGAQTAAIWERVE